MEPAGAGAEPVVADPVVPELELEESVGLDEEALLVELLLDESLDASLEELLDEPDEPDDLLDPPDRLSVL